MDKAFQFLSISGVNNLVGTSADKAIKYSSDYDLNEMFRKPRYGKYYLDNLYKCFLEKFRKARHNPNLYIVDFKCGLDTDGEPLRWNDTDMERGWKMLKDGRKISFQECLLVKSIMKLDVIALVDGIYRDITEVYFIKLGDSANFLQHDLTKGHVRAELERSYDTLVRVDNNYFKALRRLYSLDKLEGRKKEQKVLVEFFNSPVGILNKARSDLDTLILVLSQPKFRDRDLKALDRNLQLILKSIHKYLPGELRLKSRKQALDALTHSRDELFSIVNSVTASLF